MSYKIRFIKRLIRYAFLLTTLFLSSCYAGPESPMLSYIRDHDAHVYKFYPGNALPESEIVTIDLTHAAHVVIDGFNISGADYQQVQILPGRHEFLWGKDQGHTVVDLAAGHTYELRWDRAHGRGQKVYFWIQDAQSQEVISGTKKP